MSGILGGSAKTDRGNQLAATQADWNLFSYGLPQAQAAQATGTASLGTAQQYYQSLLAPGKTTAATLSAPAINSALSGADAQKRQAAAEGTGRSGGTAEVQAEAGAKTQGGIDDIINQTLQTSRKEGAQGLEQVGGLQLSNAISNLGLSSQNVNEILENSTASRGQSFDIQSAEGSAVGGLILAGLGI